MKPTKNHTVWRLLRLWWLLAHRHTRRQLGTFDDWKVRVIFWVGALAVGLAIQSLAWASEWSFEVFQRISSVSPYIMFLVTPLGLMAIVWFMQRVAPASRGSGIPQVLLVHKQSYHWLRGAFLSYRVAVAKFVLTCLGLMIGGSIGREGPSVHIGAALMYRLGSWGNLNKKYVESGMIVAGGAAGVSAAFNAPLAGIVFAIEELQQSLEARSSGTLTLAIILSGVVVLSLAGHYSHFGEPIVDPTPLAHYPVVIAVSIACGLTGGLFGRLLVLGSRLIDPWLRSRPLRVALMIGLALALLGFISGGASMGSGYLEAKALLAGEAEGSWMASLTKILATLLTYFSGIPGGIFSPSLAAGAQLGAAFGNSIPGIPPVTLILVSMAAYFAGVVQRPITSFVIVLELTGNDHGILPTLMLSTFVATAASKLVMAEPIYHALAQALARSWEPLVDPSPSDGTESESGEKKLLPEDVVKTEGSEQRP